MKLKLKSLAIVAVAYFAFTACGNHEAKQEETVATPMADTTAATEHVHEHNHGDTVHTHGHAHDGDTTMHAH